MLHVVLVEPQTPGNVGAAARAARNFGVTDLHVVGDLVLDGEAEERARDAVDLLREAGRHEDLADVQDELDLLAGFTSRTSRNPKRHTREAVGLDAFAEDVAEVTGDVGLVFGPEDTGLSNDDILLCDVPVTIPTSDAFPSMNLSHAVAVALYAVSDVAYEPPADEYRPLDGPSKELLHDAFHDVLHAIDIEERRRDHTMTAWRRIMGRALPSEWEYHRIMGVLGEVVDELEAGEEGDPDGEEAGDET